MGSVSNPSGVRFSGPLTGCAPGLVEELAGLGYTVNSAATVMRLVAHLSGWLEREGLDLDAVNAGVIDRFLAERRATHTHSFSIRALRPVLDYLRREGLVPAETLPVPSSSHEVLLARYRRYLLDERGLSGPVADAYAHWIGPFVREVLGTASAAQIGALTAVAVSEFVAARLPSMSRKSAQMTACALRSFLRFLHHQHLVDVMLADAVPAVAHRRLSGLPEPLTREQVDALIGACDRSTTTGRRDYAVITVLHRLGLRCGEVAELRLGDVDWRAGTLMIRGKGGRLDRLPLPVDVGEALVAYLRDGRPATTAKTVFVRAVAPHTSLGHSSVSCIVGRAAKRAGLGTIHAHRLRHTTASRVLNAGASLEEVSHVLRHASVATTAIYAKTDLTRLMTIARPWPVTGGVS